MRVVLILLVATLAVACSPRIIPSRTETRIHYEKIHDTIINHVTDSALIAAFLECDSVGRVRIRDLLTENGNLVKLNAQLRDNILKIQGQALGEVRYKEIIRTNTVCVEVKVPVPYKVVKEKTVYKLRWYNKILMWLGLFYLGKTAFRLATGWKTLTIKTVLKILFL